MSVNHVTDIGNERDCGGRQKRPGDLHDEVDGYYIKRDRIIKKKDFILVIKVSHEPLISLQRRFGNLHSSTPLCSVKEMTYGGR